MAKLTDARVVTLKGHFDAGDQPTAAQFADLIQWIQEGIEEHQHDSTGDGDGTGILNGPITMAEDAWIGIGAALERIVFNGSGDAVAVRGASFAVGTYDPVVPIQSTGGTNTIPALGAAGGGFYVTADNANYGILMGSKADGKGWIQVQRVDGAATIYSLLLQPNGGNIGLGTITPATSALLEMSSTTGALLLTRMTTTQRDALTAVNGMVIYNTTTNKIEGRENGSWIDL